MRAEHVTLSKEVVVRERVVVRRHPVEEVAREQLRTSQSGAVDIVEQDTEKVPLTWPAINGIHVTKGD